MAIKPSARAEALSDYYFQKVGQKLAALARAGADVINLGIGSPDLPPSSATVDALSRAARQGDIHGYQPYNGTPALREAMSAWYRRIYSVELDPAREVLPLLGSKEGIFYISMAYLNPGDVALVPDPGYAAYSGATALVGATPVSYNLTESNGWLPDLDELSALASKNTRIVWLNYPHMPTGTLADEKTLRAVIAFCRERNILLCHDNPYSLVLNESAPLSIMQFPEAREGCLELNSLSKSHRMAGWRVGMVVGDAALISNVLRIKGNIDSGMFKAVQQAAVEALSAPDEWYTEQNAVYRRRREVVWRMLDILGFSYTRRQAGLFIWARVPDTIADVVAFTDELVQTKHVFIIPGMAFGWNGSRFVRVSLCATEERLEEAVRRIQS